jgi:hypothetical protein
MAKFVIAIGMLLGGMSIAQSVGGEAGSAMGKIFSKGNKTGAALGLGALALSGKAIGRGTRNAALTGVGKMANLASDKDIVTGKREGTKLGNFALQWKTDLVETRRKEKLASREKYLKKIGITEKSAELGQDLANTDAMQKLGRISRGAVNYASAGALAGTMLGPVGSFVGGSIGGSIGLVAGGFGGYASKEKYEKAKAAVKSYEQKDSLGVSQQSKDKILTDLIQNRKNTAKANKVGFDLEKIQPQKKELRYKELDRMKKIKKLLVAKIFLVLQLADQRLLLEPIKP